LPRRREGPRFSLSDRPRRTRTFQTLSIRFARRMLFNNDLPINVGRVSEGNVVEGFDRGGFGQNEPRGDTTRMTHSQLSWHSANRMALSERSGMLYLEEAASALGPPPYLKCPRHGHPPKRPANARPDRFRSERAGAAVGRRDGCGAGGAALQPARRAAVQP